MEKRMQHNPTCFWYSGTYFNNFEASNTFVLLGGVG